MRNGLAKAALLIALSALLLTSCSTGAQSDAWYRSLEVVPASEVSSSGYVSPGTLVSPGHRVLIPGMFIESAVTRDIRPYGRCLVIQYDSDGEQRWTQLTAAAVGQRLLFVLNGKVVACVVINAPMDTGHFGVPLTPPTVVGPSGPFTVK